MVEIMVWNGILKNGGNCIEEWRDLTVLSSMSF